jgi:serine/threonine protein kinase
MISALKHCHDKKICHRDLKPENIMLTSTFDLKLIDFGFAAPLDKYGTEFLKTFLGTRSYMAPEILMQKEYEGIKVDLFASAVILFIMVTGRPPFNQASPKDQIFKVLATKKYNIFWKAHKLDQGQVSNEFVDLIQKMMALLPKQRLSIDEIMNHAWFKGTVPTQQEVMAEFTERNKKVMQAK